MQYSFCGFYSVKMQVTKELLHLSSGLKIFLQDQKPAMIYSFAILFLKRLTE